MDNFPDFDRYECDGYVLLVKHEPDCRGYYNSIDQDCVAVKSLESEVFWECILKDSTFVADNDEIQFDFTESQKKVFPK